jgi:hypothetical protein
MIQQALCPGSPKEKGSTTMTTIDAFRSSVSAEMPPPDIGPALQALWWLLRGDWARAHECVQQQEGEPDCDWVHAHLHRQEGDMRNASGWYQRAGRPVPSVPLQVEWSVLATEMLARQ